MEYSDTYKFFFLLICGINARNIGQCVIGTMEVKIIFVKYENKSKIIVMTLNTVSYGALSSLYLHMEKKVRELILDYVIEGYRLD